MSDQKPAKGAWKIVTLLFLFMLINFADKAVIGLAGVPIMTDLNLSPKQFGLVGSSFFFLFSISAVVTGFLVNRIKSKLALLVMGLVWALVQFPMLGTVGIETLIACRVILGAGEGPAYPVALHAIYKWFPDAARAVPGAIVGQGAALGVIVAVPILSWTITNYGWHNAFGLLGVVGLIWVLLWALLGNEGKVDDDLPKAESGARIPYRSLLLSSTNLASWCAYFAAYFGLALVLSWFTAFLVKGLAIPQQLAGQLTALPFLVGFVVLLLGSFASERMMKRGVSSRKARGVLSGFCMIAGGLALLAAPLVSSLAVKLALIVAGTSLPSVIFVLSPAILAEITPPVQRGAVLAINSAVGTAAGIIAPYLMGTVIEDAVTPAAGYSLGFSICGAVTLVGGVVGLLFLNPDRQQRSRAVGQLFAPHGRAQQAVA
jgi:MFS family permease